MNELHDFLAEVRAFLNSLEFLSPSERAEVDHLVDHDEIGEALRTLAWIIVEEGHAVPPDVHRAIRSLSAGLVVPEQMPPDFRGENSQ